MPDQDLTAQFPLIAETPLSIIARLLVSANAGIDPTDPAYADTIAGSWFSDMSGAFSLESDRIYDRMLTELPAAALPSTATGEWLDGWATIVDLTRKAAATAGGVETFTGPDGTVIDPGTEVSTESPTADADPITFQTTEGGTISGGSVDLPIQAVEPGSAGNVPPNAITILNTPIDGVSITNALGTSSGADVETDGSLSDRVVRKLQGTSGAGNVDYYANIALNTSGVGYVTVQANTPSVGHVTVVISDANRQPASAVLIATLQAILDPSDDAGQGAGLAAPGATVVVTTPTGLTVAIAATVVCDDGYSIDGAAGTQSVAPDVDTVVQEYGLTLATGDDVIYNKVLGAIVDVPGVADVTELTLTPAGGSAVSANVAVDATHIAELETPVALST